MDVDGTLPKTKQRIEAVCSDRLRLLGEVTEAVGLHAIAAREMVRTAGDGKIFAVAKELAEEKWLKARAAMEQYQAHIRQHKCRSPGPDSEGKF